MTSTQLQRKLVYQDGYSAVAIWWKAFFMAPVWGAAVIPLLGAISLVFVHGKSVDFIQSPGWQIALAFTIASCIAYFVDDLRKREIRVSDGKISFGLRKYHLDKLVLLGVEYKEEQLMPRKIVLRFRDGRVLRLKVSCLHNDEFESFLHFIETRLPQVHIDPVLLTLMRCRKAAGKAISDSGESVEIRYNSRFVFGELKDVFTNAWDEWSKFGPVLLSLFTAPFWTLYISSLFMTPAVYYQIYTSPTNIDIVQMVNKLSTLMWTGIGELARSGNYKCVVDVAGHPVTSVLLLLLTGGLFYGLLKAVKQPNRIIVQADSIQLILRLGSHSLCMHKIPVNSIERVSLYRPNENADPASWMLRFQVAGKKTIDLALAALSTDEKSRLTRAIQRLAPQVPVDVDLLENMIARQERSYTELWLQSLSSAPERHSLEPLQPGQALSELRYQIVRCLGVGGQGTAYLAKDTSLVESRLNEMLVLKESIFPVYAESHVRMQALERFEKEASLLRRLEHPGIVSLRDFFLEDHRGYLVMEHVDGKSLKQLVEEDGAFSEMRVRQLALQMSEILTYLHANGVIHRDFTPDNLILSKNGQLKLIDFNVAQQVESGSTGTIVGKQCYLPPEQFRGKATNQSDIYAMGATLYFMLTGEEPEPISMSSPVQNGAVCSESLDRLVRDCTALQQSKRVQNAEELKQRLMTRSELHETDEQGTADGLVLDLSKSEEEVFELENR